MDKGMDMFLQVDSHPFTNGTLSIACNRDCDMSYRLLYHGLLWQYMKKFFQEVAIPIEIIIPTIAPIHRVMEMGEYYGWDIYEVNAAIFSNTLEYCGWQHYSIQLDFVLSGRTVMQRLREIKAGNMGISEERFRKMVQFQDVVEEAYNLEFGNEFVLISSQEIGWYKGFAETHKSWIQEHFAKVDEKITELLDRMDEPFYQQFSVNSGLINGEYVVALSMGREVEHYVDEETLDMNWIISAHIVHELINIIRREWERKEQKRVGHDITGTSAVSGVPA